MFLEHPPCEDCGLRVVILIPSEKKDPDLGRLVGCLSGAWAVCIMAKDSGMDAVKANVLIAV